MQESNVDTSRQGLFEKKSEYKHSLFQAAEEIGKAKRDLENIWVKYRAAAFLDPRSERASMHKAEWGAAVLKVSKEHISPLVTLAMNHAKQLAENDPDQQRMIFLIQKVGHANGNLSTDIENYEHTIETLVQFKAFLES